MENISVGLVLSAKIDESNMYSIKNNSFISECVVGSLQSAKQFACSFLLNPSNEF